MSRHEEKQWTEEKHELVDQNVCLKGLLQFVMQYKEANPHSHYYRKLREENRDVQD